MRLRRRLTVAALAAAALLPAVAGSAPAQATSIRCDEATEAVCFVVGTACSSGAVKKYLGGCFY